jgi:hypothetical protein
MVWGEALKKTHTWSGGTGVRTRDLPNIKWRARRLATILVSQYEEYCGSYSVVFRWKNS